jgi:thiamine biosynthesis lipoprotein
MSAAPIHRGAGTGAEEGRRFACFGGTCEVRAAGAGARAAVERARERLLEWHGRFTRFDPGSELSRLNADARGRVPVSPTMAALAGAVVGAAELTGGLVDGTLLHEVEDAGYRTRPVLPVPLPLLLRLAPARRPARPSPAARWRGIAVAGGELRRPPGVALDSGGLAKGLFADLLADELGDRPAFVVDCCGDLRLGGAEPRAVHVAGPFARAILHTFELRGGGVATSGIGRRSWIGPDGRAAHHLLDPGTGRPAFTGVVQATALAPTALEAEVRAKAAVLSGPAGAPDWLEHGGVLVLDDGSSRVVAPPAA